MRIKISVLSTAAAAALLLSSCAGGDGPADDQRDVTGAQAPMPTQVVMESALVGHYAAPSLAAFAKTPFITKVVTGRVVSTKPKVYADATVYTEVTLQLDGDDSGQVTARESGGIVKVRDVRQAFEGHVSDAEIARRANDSIEFVDSEFPERSKVGQRVVAMLSGQSDEPGGYFIAARLVLDGAGSYAWPASPPNGAWAWTIDKKVGVSLARTK